MSTGKLLKGGVVAFSLICVSILGATVGMIVGAYVAPAALLQGELASLISNGSLKKDRDQI